MNAPMNTHTNKDIVIIYRKINSYKQRKNESTNGKKKFKLILVFAILISFRFR